MKTLRHLVLSASLLAGALTAAGCTPSQECASRGACDLATDPSAAHCAYPTTRDHTAVVEWIHCTLTALREHRPIDGGFLFVVRRGSQNLPYLATQLGSEVVYGPCPRVVARETFLGQLLVTCGTNDYNPFGAPVLFPHDDSATLLTAVAIDAQLHSAVPAVVVDSPEAIGPSDTLACTQRGLVFSDSTDPYRCGLLGPANQSNDAGNISYAGFTCHAH